MEKVAIYTRTARKNTAGIKAQVEMCKQYAKKNGFHVVKVYKDNGKSGTKTKRRALRKLLKKSKKGKFCFVVIYSVDRLSRNMTDYLMLEKQLAKYGVKIISVVGGA